MTTLFENRFGTIRVSVKPSPEDEISVLLGRVAAGEPADDRLIHMVHSHLRTIARRMMRAERQGHTLQPTALVNEAWLKLNKGEERAYADREHFFNLAAAAMRQILTDHARAKLTERRTMNPEARQRLQEGPDVNRQAVEMISLDQALKKLEERDPRLAKIVELRCFCDLSVEEAAEVLGISPTTVKREWKIAKSLLQHDLERPASA